MGRPNTALVVSDADREQLSALVRSQSMPHALVRRARIVQPHAGSSPALGTNILTTDACLLAPETLAVRTCRPHAFHKRPPLVSASSLASSEDSEVPEIFRIPTACFETLAYQTTYQKQMTALETAPRALRRNRTVAKWSVRSPL